MYLKEELISVIVSVYNLEYNMRFCIESILNQTYRNLEIIIVDDGSTDNTLEICQNLKKSDNRIIVVSKKNGGPSSARNAGYMHATGKYVTFVDGDDVLHEECIEYLYTLLTKNNADISICGFEMFYDLNRNFNMKVSKEDKTYFWNGYDALKAYLYQKHFITANWGRLYKKDILKYDKFPEGNCADDFATNYRFIMRAKHVVYGTKKLYFYYQRQDSIVHSWLSQREYDCVRTAQEMFETITETYPELESAVISRVFSTNIQILSHIPFNEVNSESHSKVIDNIRKFRKNVLCDKEARTVTRVSAMVSYIGIKFLKICLAIVYK